MQQAARGFRPLLTALALLAIACGHAPPPRPSPLFRDHTRSRLTSIADFEALSAPGAGKLRSVKLVIERFDTERRAVHFLDGNFFTFHDEWLWFQTLNGIPVDDHEAFAGPGFGSPAEATAWAHRQSELPLDLELTEDRLYSDAFYDRALADDRSFGVGALVHVSASDSHPELWGFELEYSDLPERAHVETFHAALSEVLPPEIARNLRWLTRSVAQAKLAVRMRAERSRVATLAYAELATTGESEVYSTGSRVGRLRRLEPDRSAIEQASERDVLVVPAPLDDLPPVAGIISLVPLTPLSHFNVLARQRGIPCVYVGGVDTDPYLSTLIRAQAPVLLDARADGVWIAPMSDTELASVARPMRAAVQQSQPADPRSMPYVRALDALQRDASDRRTALQQVGGKMMGFVALAALDPSDRPSPVAAITARAYAEHVEPLMPTLRALLQDAAFRKSPRLRLLALEGPKAFAREYPNERDRAWATRLGQGQGALAQVIAAGGVQAMIRARELRPETLRIIREQLGTAMSAVSRAQGLRLRSSSTLEDIEGFNAAGLYDSSTGYLDGEGKKSLDAAIKRTWASYWTYRAFEERRRAGLQSLLGRMAIVVHPRFDDAQELANAVVTFALYPPEAPVVARMDVNAQLGSLSVTNPPVDRPDALPEVTRVTLSRADPVPRITRIRASTELAAGEHVFDDAALTAVLEKLRPLAQHWLELQGTGVDAAARARMATLDLELRRMAPEWPEGSAQTRSEPRWIIKQVRSLEPPAEIPGIAELELPIPADVLVRSVKIVRRTCQRAGLYAELIEAYTGADLDPDLGYSKTPFVASLLLKTARRTAQLTHLDLARVPDRLHIELAPQAAAAVGMPLVDLSGARCEEHIEAADQSALLQVIAKRARRLD